MRSPGAERLTPVRLAVTPGLGSTFDFRRKTFVGLYVFLTRPQMYPEPWSEVPKDRRRCG
jgi:hypothetical protein